MSREEGLKELDGEVCDARVGGLELQCEPCKEVREVVGRAGWRCGK